MPSIKPLQSPILTLLRNWCARNKDTPDLHGSYRGLKIDAHAGFENVPGSASFKGCPYKIQFLVNGKKDNLRRALCLLQLVGDFESVHFWHGNVENQHV